MAIFFITHSLFTRETVGIVLTLCCNDSCIRQITYSGFSDIEIRPAKLPARAYRYPLNLHSQISRPSSSCRRLLQPVLRGCGAQRREMVSSPSITALRFMSIWSLIFSAAVWLPVILRTGTNGKPCGAPRPVEKTMTLQPAAARPVGSRARGRVNP